MRGRQKNEAGGATRLSATTTEAPASAVSSTQAQPKSAVSIPGKRFTRHRSDADSGTQTTTTTAAATSTQSDSTQSQHAPRPGAKNRPTPKRKDQEAARRKPLVPADREAAKKADKERSKQDRLAHRQAAERGEESALATRDRGPAKRYIRDRVDSRLSLGEIVMPLFALCIVGLFFPNQGVKEVTLLIAWVAMLAGMVDAILSWFRIKKGLVARFGTVERGSAMYAITRSFQIRRARFPKPQVRRGQKVD